MLKNIRYLTNLESLDLSCNQITDASMYRFGDEISHMVCLRGVDLRHNLLGDLSLEALRDAISRMPLLQHVLIAENCGYYQEATAVLQQVKSKRSLLRHIGVNMNRIPQEGVLSMRPVSVMSENQQQHQSLIAIDSDVNEEEDDDGNGASSRHYDVTLNGRHGSDGDDAEEDDDYSEEGDADLAAAGDAINDTSRVSQPRRRRRPRHDDSALHCNDVSFEVLDRDDSTVNPDLLVGRPDKYRAVPLRRHNLSRGASMPKMKDFRRSWHGAGLALRDSFRQTRESLNDLRAGDFRRSVQDRTNLLRNRCVYASCSYMYGIIFLYVYVIQ